MSKPKIEIPTPKRPLNHKKTEHKPDKWFMRKRKAKKVANWIVKTVAGETNIGEGLHGILDLLPIPNQVFAKSASYFTKGNTEEAKRELGKLLSVRNGIALLAFILFATGTITLQDMITLLEAIGNFL